MIKTRTARFQIGQIVRHRIFSFRGVIFDIDPEFNNTEEWWLSIPEEVRPHKDQPFYHLLAENQDTEYVAYVSEQNLVPDRSGEALRHARIAEFGPRIVEIAVRREVGRLRRVVVAFGLSRGGWLEGALAGIATAMSVLPEEFPVVLTVFVSLGAWRMSQRHVLARRAAVVESLGSVSWPTAEEEIWRYSRIDDLDLGRRRHRRLAQDARLRHHGRSDRRRSA